MNKRMTIISVALSLCGFVFLLQASAWGQTGRKSTDEFFREGMANYNKGDYEQAIRVLEEALKENPEEARVLFYLGYAYYKHGDFEDARAAFEEAYRLRPDYTPIPKIPELTPQAGG
jgi:cytochrome c-type biogenesis protein CcmH/NrfG